MLPLTLVMVPARRGRATVTLVAVMLPSAACSPTAAMFAPTVTSARVPALPPAWYLVEPFVWMVCLTPFRPVIVIVVASTAVTVPATRGRTIATPVTVNVPSAFFFWAIRTCIPDGDVRRGRRLAALGHLRVGRHGDRPRPAVVRLERDARAVHGGDGDLPEAAAAGAVAEALAVARAVDRLARTRTRMARPPRNAFGPFWSPCRLRAAPTRPETAGRRRRTAWSGCSAMRPSRRPSRGRRRARPRGRCRRGSPRPVRGSGRGSWSGRPASPPPARQRARARTGRRRREASRRASSLRAGSRDGIGRRPRHLRPSSMRES